MEGNKEERGSVSVMRRSWKFFVIIEVLLVMAFLGQIFTDSETLFGIVISVMIFILELRKKKRSFLHQILFIGSIVVMTMYLLSLPSFWLFLTFTIIFLLLKGVEISGEVLFKDSPWNKKRIIIIETTESTAKAGKKIRNPWFDNERIGTNIYEWDDLNITALAGDTIIDLGNTILPKEDNVIMIRKGFGRTRILVPFGIGIMLDHSTFKGNVIFEGQTYELKNETLNLYSEDYDSSPRKLKIATSTLFGDVEVIRI